MNRRISTFRDQKRDESGKKLCKVCQSKLPPRRSSYCSDECWLRNTPAMMRRAVQKRDQGICAICGLDTKTVKSSGGYYGTRHKWEADHILPVSEGGGLCGLDGYRTLCKGAGTNNCHGKVSGELRKRLNARKRVELTQKQTGKLF